MSERQYITKLHPKVVREVQNWILRQGNDPLAADVLGEVAGKLDAYIKNRAMITVRAKNAKHAETRKPARIEWSLAELDTLRELVKNRVPYAQMPERLTGRTWQSCATKAHALKLRMPPAPPKEPDPLTRRQEMRRRPILQIAHEVRARRLERERKMSHG